MGLIAVEGIKLFAYHGCLQEEGIIGGHYIVDVYIKTNLKKAAASDFLSDTVDYVTVYRVVKEQMQIRSNLIEHVAKRILTSLRAELNEVEKLEVRVTKLSPPMNGDVERVSVLMKD